MALSGIESDRIKYFGIGSLTPEVASTLVGRDVAHWDVVVRGYEVRMLTPELMSETEREIMQGGRRFIPVANKRVPLGIKGWMYYLEGETEHELLADFDITDPKAYDLRTVNGRLASGEISGVLVARRRFGPLGELRDPMRYDPYEPFESVQQAVEIARQSRQLTLNRLAQD